MHDDGETQIAPGDLIDGKYRVIRLLGVGGSGRVYEAENTWIQLRVALKVLRAGAVTDVATVERFKGEALVAARVAHPNIAAVFDMGRDARTGSLFIVQELLDGADLRARLTEAKKLTAREALAVMIPVGEALRVAHARGFVHRDLKPENIVLTRDADGVLTPKLIDFGVAHPLGDRRATPAARVGTPGYMAPEQVRGVPDLDARVDVWAFGAVLFEALSGRRPYAEVPPEARLYQVTASAPTALVSVAPDVSAALCAVVDRALSPDRDARYAGMPELLEALRATESDGRATGASSSMRPQRPRVLLVDDDDLLRGSIVRTLTRYEVVTAADGQRALDLLRSAARFDLVVTDLSMPKVNGLEVVRAAAGIHVPTIMISGTATVDTAVEAMRLGVVNFITKPFKSEGLLAAITDVLAARQVHRATREELIGEAPSLRDVLELATSVADTDATVLLTGETGVGKEVLARLLHRLSARCDGPFVTVDAAALTEAEFEAELFGDARVEGARGLLAEAEGGTLFFDEVGDMPYACQARILRLVQERSWNPAREGRPRKANVRILASTRHDLTARIAKDTFRADLYYRLSVVTLHTPPLRERRSDIPALVEHFIFTAAEEHRRVVTGIDAEALEALCGWSWPGNVRELRNAVTRMVIGHRGGALTMANVPPEVAGSAARRLPTAPPVDRDAERAQARQEAERIGEAIRPRGSSVLLEPKK
jgi:DNA-binding NtrC family response regulator